jgi:hypothetical protein
MIKNGFLRFCDDPELACCRAERELGQLREENVQLRSQLQDAERRAAAAVRDINSVRMCHTCKHFLREFGMGGIECKIPCATIRHENFEWRGPQAGEESR